MGAITRAAANNITTGGIILPAGITDSSVASITSVDQVAAGGGLNLISTATASASASIEFTSGIDSTYDIYYFEFINIHPSASPEADFQFNLSTDGGSNYNVTKTTTFFRPYHEEAGADSSGLAYQTGKDLAQSTAYQSLSDRVSADNDGSCSGTLQIFNPSSSTYVKHFIANFNRMFSNESITAEDFIAGYGNTTSAINAIRFQFSSGNIDAGTIRMYGVTSS